MSGAIVAGSPRIVEVDDHPIELPPAEVMVVVRNDDRPGMIGVVGTVLGDAGVNIANMAVGQTEGAATAVMVLAIDRPVDQEVLDRLASAPGILEVSQVSTA